MVVGQIIVGTLTACTASALAFSARELLQVAETAEKNRERSQTNRAAVRSIIENTDTDLEADPITGLQSKEGGGDRD